MKIDITLLERDIREAGHIAARAEGVGHDAAWATEAGHDPFLQAYSAIERTTSIDIGTAIAVAFARTPMTVAYSAWNLAQASDGRFTLGLGSQIKPHIEKRYSMPWGKPVAQMREFLVALDAIWTSWRTGEPLDHRGEYYTHRLMSPFWVPSPHEHRIPVYLAAVGPRMTELAGERCDGILMHAFTNRPFLESVALPALDRGIATAGKTTADVEVSLPLFMIMGDTDEELATRRHDAAQQLAFYASTPAYAPVLEAVGYGDVQPELTQLSKRGEWDAMADLFDDELLGHFAIIGAPEQMPELSRQHVGPRVQRTSSYFGWPIDDPDRLRSILDRFHQQQSQPVQKDIDT